MSTFYELSEHDKEKVREATEEITKISKELFNLIEKKFEETTELERQVLSAFCFGMVNVIVPLKDLPFLQTHAVTAALLINVFKYSEDQTEDFVQELLNSTDEDYHPVIFSIICRGTDGYNQYVNEQIDDLKENILEVLKIVNEDS
ncbi:Imm48 family immunity protein [Metabacillus fastidiosus]|uniref:Imm48 family immunity protein n=1 Tax=Metabacillus fastidiosus TaxID=1458 RepID=UPI003D2C7FF8